MPPASPAVLQWYRVDQARRIRRVLVVGASFLSFGALVMAASFLLHARESVRSLTAFFGLACTMFGAIQTAVGMPRILLEESYLSVRRDGITLCLAGDETFVRLDDIEAVTFDRATGHVVIERQGLDPVRIDRPFSGITLQDLAKRLADLRRKAQFDLLRG